MVQMLVFGGGVKFGFRKKDKKIFNPGVKKIKRGPDKENKRDYILPFDRHKQHPPKFFISFFQM